MITKNWLTDAGPIASLVEFSAEGGSGLCRTALGEKSIYLEYATVDSWLQVDLKGGFISLSHSSVLFFLQAFRFIFGLFWFSLLFTPLFSFSVLFFPRCHSASSPADILRPMGVNAVQIDPDPSP